MSLLTFPGSARASESADRAPSLFDVLESTSGSPGHAAPPDAAGREQALDVSRSWIVEAPAGSGKTGLLIQRFLKLLGTVDEPEAVMALTFTNKATAEMRDRVLRALDTAAGNDSSDPLEPFERTTRALARAALLQNNLRGWHLQENTHRLNIRTIDSLCGAIARAVPVLSGGIGQAEPQPDAGPLYAAAARAVFLQFGGLDAELNAAIERVLLLRDGDIHNCERLLADMLAQREQWGTLVPITRGELGEDTLDAHVLPALNHTLQEIICPVLDRLHRCFPAALLADIAELAHLLGNDFASIGDDSPLLACADFRRAPQAEAEHLERWKGFAHLLLTKGGTWRKTFVSGLLPAGTPDAVKKRLRFVWQELESNEELRAALCALEDLPPGTYPPEQWAVAKALFLLLHHALLELQLLFAERQVCDFTQHSIAARAALREADSLNRVTAALGMRLQHLLVDEMQDTSSSQYDLLERLTQGWSAPNNTVFLVGDPKQSIYLFRQARVERFLQAMEHRTLGDLPLGLLRLTANFRSGTTLVQECNALFMTVFSDPADPVTYTAAEPVRPTANGEELRWHAEPLPFTQDALVRAGERKRSTRQEAETIAHAAAAWRERPLTQGRTAPWKIAVLVRTRDHARIILRALAEAQVPFRAVEMDALGERAEVLDAFALTRALLHPADRVAWLALLRAPWCGISMAAIHTLVAGDAVEESSHSLRLTMRQRLDHLQPDARERVTRLLDIVDAAIAQRGREPITLLVERTWQSLGGPLALTATEQVNVRRYLDLLRAEEETGAVLTAERLATRMQRLFAEPESAPDAVEVMTIHKAKGLEWDLVLVPALERGGGRGAAPLLDWLELPPGHDGRARVLLAPVPPRGDHAGSLNRYIRKARDKQRAAELKRLLYVVATRARTSLQLFASPARTREGFLIRPDTLLHVARPVAEPHLVGEADAVPPIAPLAFPAASLAAPGLIDSLAANNREAVADAQPAVLQRLPLSVAPQQLLHAESLAMAQPMQQSSREVAFARPTGSFAARALGNAVHLFLEYLAAQIAAQSPGATSRDWQQQMARWQHRIHAVVRGAGLPQRDVERTSELVRRALRNSVTHTHALWLLQPHTAAASESEMSELVGGELRRYRIDRSFFAGEAPGLPGEDVLWIIDYKTADHSEADRERFLSEERQKYRRQLETYARLRAEELPADTRVMLALYHPLLPHLDYWPYEPEAIAD